jgi:ferric-dicitrate binding protein FerR (iron transport regulator)
MAARKSEVVYQDRFTGNGRDITLKGNADFNVTKDKTKSFTVYSFDLATTVLGTRFTVSAFENEKDMRVRSQEGKVRVRSTAFLHAKLNSDYYLQPGDELIYNRSNYTVKVSSSRQKARHFEDDIVRDD